MHLIDLSVTSIIFYLNFGHGFALFLLDFDWFDTFLRINDVNK